MGKYEIRDSIVQINEGNNNMQSLNIPLKNDKELFEKIPISIDEKLQQKNVSIEQILDNWGFRPGGFSHGKREEKKADIEKWLRRFSPSEFDDAFLILERIQYHDSRTIDRYMEGLSKEIKKILGDDLTKVKFYPLGESPSSSGGNFLYMYRKELGISEASFPYTPINETNFSDTIALVFFDDIIGSGNQAIRFAEKHLRDIKIDKYYVALMAFEKGLEKVKNNRCFKKVIVHEIISEELRAFSPESQIFPDADTRERIKRLCEKYGKLLYPKHPLGYDNSQALIVFPHNTPNNTLPIIWASDKNEKEPCYIWYPVWERIKRMPIIYESDESIKGMISEIQEKANALRKKTNGTSLEEIGLETVKQANELSSLNEIKMDKSLALLFEIPIKFSEYIPADKREGILEDLKKANYLDIPVMVETIAKKLEEIYKNFAFPPIITVSANKENKQKQAIVRIAAIQLAFKFTNSFPPVLEKKEECKQKIISALDTAKSRSAHIACLPELCMCEEWVQEFKDRYPDMIIIGGSFYKNDFNECPVIMNIKVPPQLKKSPSRFEDPEITGRGMKTGDKLYRYETQFGTFSVLVCIDFLNYAKFCDNTDIIFCPSYTETKGIERFHEYANSHVTNTPSYIIISNTALFGGTSIFGQLHRDYYRGLVENGCKRGDDDSYKLCDLEKGFEGIIIADFDLVHKSSQVPTPADSNKVIKSIKNIKKNKDILNDLPAPQRLREQTCDNTRIRTHDTGVRSSSYKFVVDVFVMSFKDYPSYSR